MYDEVRDILMKIGYSCKKGDVMVMNARISALKSRAQYDLDKISKERMRNRRRSLQNEGL